MPENQFGQSEFTVSPALCLDLDGTIRYSKRGDFIEELQDIVLFEGVEEVLWDYREKGFMICGITNQAGVAFGYKNEADVIKELEVTQALFSRNPFHTIQYSLNHPKGKEEPYNHRSLLRKPQIGMLVLCEHKFWEEKIIIDWDKSIFVGDRNEDQACALQAGLEFFWAKDFFSRES